MLTSVIAGAGLARVYLDTAYVSVRWERRCVIVEWKAWAASADFRAAQVMSLRACAENCASRLLVDARNMKRVLGEDERWWSQDVLPLLAMSGVRWVAVVTPTNHPAGETAGEMLGPRPKVVAETRHFGTLAEAKQWLSLVEIAG